MIVQDVKQGIYDYVLAEDSQLPENKQTIFKIKPLEYREERAIEDIIGGMIGVSGYPAGTVNHKLLKSGLVGWENMKDRNGKEVKFKADKTGILDELLERLTTQQRTELALEIWGTRNLTDEETKN